MLPAHRVRILVATQPVDFRKGHDGLAALVQAALKEDPFTGTVFVFRAKRADRLKLLFWDGTGLVFAIGLERMATRWLTLQAAGGDDLRLAGGQRRRDDAEPGAVRGPVRRAGLAQGPGAGSPPARCGRVNRGVRRGARSRSGRGIVTPCMSPPGSTSRPFPRTSATASRRCCESMGNSLARTVRSRARPPASRRSSGASSIWSPS